MFDSRYTSLIFHSGDLKRIISCVHNWSIYHKLLNSGILLSMLRFQLNRGSLNVSKYQKKWKKCKYTNCSWNSGFKFCWTNKSWIFLHRFHFRGKKEEGGGRFCRSFNGIDRLLIFNMKHTTFHFDRKENNILAKVLEK